VRAFEFIYESILLLEDRIDFLRKQMVPLILQQNFAEDELQAIHLFDYVIDQDPDPKKSHVQWLFNTFLRKKNPQPLEDLEAATDALSRFMELRKQRLLIGQRADINSYKSIRELEDVVGTVGQSVQAATNAEKNKAIEESKIVFNNKEVTIIQPLTKYAACYFGAESEWCTAWGYEKGRHPTRTNMFASYIDRGPIYILEPKQPIHQGERYQIQMASNQYMDEKDRNIGLVAIVRRFPSIEKFLITSSSFDAMSAYSFCRQIGKRVPELEEIIAAELTPAYWYAQDVIHGRWPEAEPIFATDPQYSYVYARNVLDGDRFELGEKAIAESAEYSYVYARNVLDGDRFELGERAIASDPEYAVKYMKYVLNGDAGPLLQYVDQDENKLIIFAKDEIIDKIVKEINELCVDYAHDTLGEWEMDDDYYYNYLIDQGCADEDGTVDWDKVEEKGLNYLDYNDDARDFLNKVHNLLDPSAKEIREWVNEENPEAEFSDIPRIIYDHYRGSYSYNRDGSWRNLLEFLKDDIYVNDEKVSDIQVGMIKKPHRR